MGCLYFPLSFYFFCDKKLSNQNIALSIVSGFSLAIIPIGILFKLLYWPGGELYMLMSLVIAPVFLIITILLMRKATTLKVYYRNMLIRTASLTVLAILFACISTHDLVNVQYGYDPELARLKYQHFANPGNEQYARELEAYQLKKDMEEWKKDHPGQ